MTEITLNREFENFYCPVTGEQVLQPDDWFPSPALEFIYLNEFDCFQYVAPHILEKYPEHFDGEGDSVEGKELLKNLKQDENYSRDKLVIIYGNLSVARLCFNMGYEAK